MILFLDIESGGLMAQYQKPEYNPILEIAIVPQNDLILPLNLFFKVNKKKQKYKPDRWYIYKDKKKVT